LYHIEGVIVAVIVW